MSLLWHIKHYGEVSVHITPLSSAIGDNGPEAVAERDQDHELMGVSNGLRRGGKALLKVLVRFGKQQNDIAIRRQGDVNSFRQPEDISVQQRVYLVPI
jgi:hypothetical protein